MGPGLWASPGRPRVSPEPGMLQPSVDICLMNTFPCYLQDLAQILFFFFGHAVGYVGSQFPRPGTKPAPPVVEVWIPDSFLLTPTPQKLHEGGDHVYLI